MNITQTKSTTLMLSACHQYSDFGNKLDVTLESEINFPTGLSAFEDYKTFTYRKEPRLKPFIYMHSVVDPNVSFVCVDPFILTPSYSVELLQNSLTKLRVDDPNDLITLCLVSVGRDMYTTTANLMSPLLINSKTMIAEQVIMNDASPEMLRYNVWNSIGESSKPTFKTKIN
ncbi:MAG: flagellar assembly protein FliW [Lentisphaeraceae bacterium]|nr:flagellar assembly protein FliW [Lentisphaeraceae bacterium]